MGNRNAYMHDYRKKRRMADPEWVRKQEDLRAKEMQSTKLRKARKERGWTQDQLCEKLGGIDVRMYRRWERGESQPSLRHLKTLCGVFGKSAEELGYGTDG